MPISLRIFHSLFWPTQKLVYVILNTEIWYADDLHGSKLVTGFPGGSGVKNPAAN